MAVVVGKLAVFNALARGEGCRGVVLRVRREGRQCDQEIPLAHRAAELIGIGAMSAGDCPRVVWVSQWVCLSLLWARLQSDP